MNILHPLALAAVFGSMLMLPACGADRSDTNAKREDTSFIGRAVNEAVTEAREEIQKGNISVSSDKGLPKAEITPQGDLLIDGKAVAINDDQRALLLEYRGHIAGVAESGMDIGVQGADLAAKAMGEAFKGVLSGKSGQEIEKSVEAEAARIKASAAKLCARLPAMMASQEKVAAAVAEFRPYATMTQDDIDDCFKDTDDGDAANAAEEAAAAMAEPKQNPK